MGDYEDEYVMTLELEDGTKVECEILGIFEVEDREYIALLPEDGSDDVWLYRYREESDSEFQLVDIEDAEEFDKVSARFDELTDVDEED